MKVGTPKHHLIKHHLIKPFDIPKTAQPKDMTPAKPMQIKPHPQHTRLEQARAIPSLVTPHKHLTPNGKGETK